MFVYLYINRYVCMQTFKEIYVNIFIYVFTADMYVLI